MRAQRLLKSIFLYAVLWPNRDLIKVPEYFLSGQNIGVSMKNK